MAKKPKPKKAKVSPPGQRLPFEPVTKKPAQPVKPAPMQQVDPAPISKSTAKQPSSQIPEVVSKRMLKRMVTFSGLPTGMGIATFPICYLLITQAGLELPNVAVVLVSMGLFGLGVVGLSYGVLSASWDEKQPGSRLGWQEFKLNFGRMTSSWRGQQKSS
jgi:Photosynthesis affected mutant 68